MEEVKTVQSKTIEEEKGMFTVGALIGCIALLLFYFVGWSYIYNTEAGVEIGVNGWNLIAAFLSGNYKGVGGAVGNVSMPFYYYAKNITVALSVLAKLEEEKEGMQEDEHHHHHDDEDEDHEHEEGEDHDHEYEHEEEYDEHVWNSLINAQKFVKSIAEELGKIDENNKDKYLANANNYNKKLDDLHKEYVTKFASATHKTLVVADRFPFSYLFSDYGLDYYAAFKGCSAESEASFETIIFLANKVNDLGLSTILKTTGSDGKIANSVKENTTSKDQKIASLYSLETKPDKADWTYIDAMKANLDVLMDASK